MGLPVVSSGNGSGFDEGARHDTVPRFQSPTIFGKLVGKPGERGELVVNYLAAAAFKKFRVVGFDVCHYFTQVQVFGIRRDCFSCHITPLVDVVCYRQMQYQRPYFHEPRRVRKPAPPRRRHPAPVLWSPRDPRGAHSS